MKPTSIFFIKISIVILFIHFLGACDFDATSDNTEEAQTNNVDTTHVVVKPTEITKKYNYFAWLLGKWKRVNNKGKSQTFEEWCKEDDTTFFGMGVTLKGSDTVFYEKMKLYKSNIFWILDVKAKGEKVVTEFKLLEFGKRVFIAENNDIDFPNRIEYRLSEKDRIKATISNKKKKILFEFEKL